MKIATVDEMRRLDAEADAAGVSYAAMMEHAGRAVAGAVLARVVPSETTAVILAGKGNNGGDGLVCARHLHDAGATVKVYSLQPPDDSDSKIAALRERSVFIVDWQNDLQSRVLKHLINGATVVVDAIFGTGVRLPLKGEPAQLLGLVKRHLASREPGPLIVAVDVPSGMDCDTGQVDANTIAAHVTVTFGAAKAGQFQFPAADYLGELIVAPIGWPDDLPGLKAVTLELADAARVKSTLPRRGRESHKYDFGRLLVVAGSKNYVGAARLVGAAAGRAGTGLVTMAVPEPIQPVLAGSLVEATWLPLPDLGGYISESAADNVVALLTKTDAVVLGPGWGTEQTTRKFLQRVIDVTLRGTQPMKFLIDADGLRLLAQVDGWHELLPKPAVLTPHPGEMAALTGMDKDAIQSDRVGLAREFADRWGHVVLLKGAFTVIASPDGRAVVEPFASPALAKAGSGDVLSGIVGSLLAQGLSPFQAAVTGAFIHGRAGLLAAEKLRTAVSVVAGDFVEAMPGVFAELDALS